MDVKLQASLIAGVVSFVVALIGHIISYKKQKDSLRKFQKEQQRELALKLYDKRLELYPKAFLITEEIVRSKGLSSKEIHEMQVTAKERIREWHGEGAALIMSARSVKMYYQLLKVLGREPGERKEYTERQRDNLKKGRSEFRSSLREDIGVLHDSADSDS